MDDPVGCTVINNIFAGFDVYPLTGNYKNHLYDWYPNCNFMVDYLPFEHQACAAGGMIS